jgi:ubiquinone/menaquinone biosynthesis C-methylase UbiE
LLKPGGVFLTLEFFRPRTAFTRFFYRVLAPVFIPFLGRALGSSREAYEYLVSSVQNFRSAEEYAGLCRALGFEHVRTVSCDFGIANVVLAVKGNGRE